MNTYPRIDSDLFLDERLWATSRIKWRMWRWWRANRLPACIILCALAYIAWDYKWGVEMRHKAEGERTLMAKHLAAQSCFAKVAPSSFIIAAGSQRDLYEALHNLTISADSIRLGWLAARKEDGKDH